MKLLLRVLFLYLPGLLLALILMASLVIWQQGLVSRDDLRALSDMNRRYGLRGTLALIEGHLFGTWEGAADPGYGRKSVAGRGHTPWVLRGNLDGTPRMLSFALAPSVWAAYDTSTASLYQVWEGELLLQGAVYDYRHGPQPEASGAWYLRRETPHSWYLESEATGELLPASVTYLGHEYGPGHETAGLRFALEAGDLRVELTEYPELLREGDQMFLLRQFHRQSGPEGVSASYEAFDHSSDPSSDLSSYRGGNGRRIAADGTVRVPLDVSTPIPEVAFERDRRAPGSELEIGERVIQNSDCLSCHHEQHWVTGPAWARVAGRFLGKIQEESVGGLAESILEGSQGKWGKLPMPPHPRLTEEEARAAATFILSSPPLEEPPDPPLDEAGEAYAATRGYDIDRPPQEVHPAFRLDDLFVLPEGFEPKVGGMDFRADGKLLIASWDQDGAVFLVDPTANGVSPVRRIAEGLHEPLGLSVVGDRLFVLQKQELTELIDRDGDEVIDDYVSFARGWPATPNFHSFAFGLVHRGEFLYASLSICVLPGGASCPEQLPTQGKLLRISLADGSAEVVASGFRTPNGIALGPGDEIFLTDNQGDWLPASKLVHIREGRFYGSRAVPDEGVMEAIETPPVVWLPQDEIGNSPTQPLLLNEGPYAGQMIHGDVHNGGIKRVYLERVAGAWQGAAFHFSGGLQSGVNRLARGPDGAIYLGEVGNPPNWGEVGKEWYGLERLIYRGAPAFEVLEVRAEPDGFTLVLTKPLHDSVQLNVGDLIARQWFYHPTEQYGGPKYDHSDLVIASLEISSDRERIRARIPGLKAGYVVYLRLDPRLTSTQGETLWVSEAWYTLNAIPGRPGQSLSVRTSVKDVPAADALEWISLFDGKTFGGWRNYAGEDGDVRGWLIREGALELEPGRFSYLEIVWSYLFGGVSGDLIYAKEKFRNFELSLEWKISENGNSGILYLVADEDHTTPWLTGIEMQVLHNEGHSDGQIHKHRAGDLYDIVAGEPETVRPPGEWNQIVIRIENGLIEHWQNGTKIVSVRRGSPEWDAALAASKFIDMPDFAKADEGYIVLQDHGDPVWYRNIRIRRLGE